MKLTGRKEGGREGRTYLLEAVDVVLELGVPVEVISLVEGVDLAALGNPGGREGGREGGTGVGILPIFVWRGRRRGGGGGRATEKSSCG